MEVRCCCDPGKVLGWIDGPFTLGQRYTFALRAKDPFESRQETVVLECDEVSERYLLTPLAAERCSGAPLTSKFKRTVALKSNDYPLALLRRIPGFREAR